MLDGVVCCSLFGWVNCCIIDMIIELDIFYCFDFVERFVLVGLLCVDGECWMLECVDVVWVYWFDVVWVYCVV